MVRERRHSMGQFLTVALALVFTGIMIGCGQSPVSSDNALDAPVAAEQVQQVWTAAATFLCSARLLGGTTARLLRGTTRFLGSTTARLLRGATRLLGTTRFCSSA